MNPRAPSAIPRHPLTALAGIQLVASAALAATFPAAFDTERTPGAPMPPAQAAAGIELPPGFRATLFAGEPDVRQPIAMATDARGRLWVAENYTYSERTVGFHPELRDRILILEDSDNDGRHDKRTVFWDGAHRLTSIEVGLGGVWALALPHLLFIPDRDGDDKPDAAPEVRLDGFEFNRARHTVANGLRWGPDGWLYGRHGILGTSHVGAPGTPTDKLIRMNVGIWRYHPQRAAFEVVAEGTTNPWGMDWDAHGEPFFINTVIGHLWHLIPGAHYKRMFGDDLNPRIYELIDQHADHVHWATGEVWTEVRKGVTNATLTAGGGHAHVGLMIYQGGQWPAAWNGKLLTVNFHGRRFNVERLEPVGSGFVGRREPDAFVFPDPWFRPIDVIAAPDGGVFVSDWSDAGECHDHDGVSRTTGRIFKLNYGVTGGRGSGDLAALSSGELVKLQRSENDWVARQARRVLADRAGRPGEMRETAEELAKLEAESRNTIHRLRALWARHVSGASDAARLTALLNDADAHVRIWAVRLLVELHATNPVALDLLARKELPALAAREKSSRVRLVLASALQRFAVGSRAPLAAALLRHAEDAEDQNLPLMLWYGIEPLAALAPSADAISFEQLVSESRIPRVQRLGARRLAEEIDRAPQRLDQLLVAAARDGMLSSRRAVLDGIAAALSGRRKATPPSSWAMVQALLSIGGDDALRKRVRDLSALFGDGRALDEIRAVALDETADVPQRKGALQALIDAQAPGLREICERLLRVRDLTATAAAGLSQLNDPSAADLLLAEWPNLYGYEKAPVMSALVSRPAWAAKALEALGSGKLARADITASQARQIRAFGDAALNQRLAAVWGDVRDRSETDRSRAFAQWKRKLSPDVLARGDLKRGRTMYQAVCASCHRLNGEGGVIGPDLTGANRDNLDYLLENILFPSAIVPDEYRQTTLTMRDGRVLAGVVSSRSDQTLRFQTASELVALDRRDIVKEERSVQSLMPEGLLDAVGDEAARDLMAYMMTK